MQKLLKISPNIKYVLQIGYGVVILDGFDKDFLNGFPGFSSLKETSAFCKKAAKCNDYQKVVILWKN